MGALLVSRSVPSRSNVRKRFRISSPESRNSKAHGGPLARRRPIGCQPCGASPASKVSVHEPGSKAANCLIGRSSDCFPASRSSRLRPATNRRYSSSAGTGRVGKWRGSSRCGLSVSAPFVWRCPSNLAVTPFPHPSHRTGHADFPHPALGQDLTPSPTTCRVRSDWQDRSTRKGAGVDRLRLCDV